MTSHRLEACLKARPKASSVFLLVPLLVVAVTGAEPGKLSDIVDPDAKVTKVTGECAFTEVEADLTCLNAILVPHQ